MIAPTRRALPAARRAAALGPRARGRVLLAPERALKLDAIGHAVLAEVDGARELGAIVARLAERYAAPRERDRRGRGALPRRASPSAACWTVR